MHAFSLPQAFRHQRIARYDHRVHDTDCERTGAEKREFDLVLPSISWLFLGLKVLILCDRSYIGRFWTQVTAARFESTILRISHPNPVLTR